MRNEPGIDGNEVAVTKKKIALWTVVAVLAAGLSAIWLARDWPRRRVQAALEAELGADVRLGRLEIAGIDRFELHRLEIRSLPAAPMLEVLRIERLSVRGSPGKILEGRIDSLHIHTARARLATPAAPVPAGDAGESRPVEIGTLVVSDMTVTVAGGGQETSFAVEGRLDGIGGKTAGRMTVTAPSFLPGPLLAVAAGEDKYRSFTERSGFDEKSQCRKLNASITVADGGREARVTVHADGMLRWSGGGDISIPFPDVDIGYSEHDDGGGSLRGTLQSDAVLSMWATAAVTDRFEAMEFEQAEARIDDPGTVLHALGIMPEGTRLEGTVKLDVLPGPDDTLSCLAGGTLQSLSVPLGKSDITARDITLSFSGRSTPGFPPSGGTFELRTALPIIKTGRTLPAVPEDLLPLTVDLRGEVELEPAVLITGSAGVSATGVGKVAGRGTVASYEGVPVTDLEWMWDGPTAGRLLTLLGMAGLEFPAVNDLSGATSAHGTLKGDPRNPRVEATVTITGLGGGVQAETAGEPFPLTLSGGALKAELVRSPDGTVEARALNLAGELQAGELPRRKFRIDTSATHLPSVRKTVFGKTTLDLSGLARLEGTGILDPGKEDYLRAEITVAEAVPSAILSYLEPLTGDLLPGYSLEGSPSGRFDLRADDEGRWSIRGTAGIRGTRLSSDDGARIVEGLDSRWSVRAGTEGPGDVITLEAEAGLDGFLLLWGRVFADYSAAAPRLVLHLAGSRVEEGDRRRWSGQAAASLDEGVTLTAGIALHPGRPAEFTVAADIDDLGAPFEKYVRSPLADSVEMLRRFSADGRIAANFSILSSEHDRTVEGRIRLDRLDMEGVQGGVYVQGLDLDLPIDLHWKDGSFSVQGNGQRGTLGFDRMALGDVGFEEATSDLVVTGDTIALEGGLSLPLLGGKLEFEKLTLTDLLQPSRHLVSGMRLSGVELRELSNALGLVVVEGKLDGYFPRVRLSRTELQVSGGGEFELFGGTVQVGDISGTDVLSPFPRLRFSARFNDIDLALVTRTFDFGEMSGILEGSIRDCELFGGVPVRFEAEMRTVPVKGVPQAINVKAINNIAILGTGGTVGVFDRGIHKFLDRYNYERLGVKMKLDNDVFLLRGTETRGERELFLKGKLPFRIDIVNVQPGKTVSFRAMADRLKDLDFATATTAPRKPESGRKRKSNK